MSKDTVSSNIIHQVYGKVILLTFLSHIIFTIIFAGLGIKPLLIYNIFSCIFYLIIYLLSQHGFFRTAVVLFHLEICVFVILTCIMLGWDYGFSIYLIALSSLVYFCPFKNKYVPYLFSIGEITIFLFLKIYTDYHYPRFFFDKKIAPAFYLYNSLCCFVLILYASFISKLSAALTERTLQESNTELQDKVAHDPLTHLWTRPHFTAKFLEIIHDDIPITIVLTDIDDFKHINDTYGHDCGDYILSELSSLIRKKCPDSAGICRWGGEEFVMMFQNPNVNSVIQLIEEIRAEVDNYHFRYGTQSLHVTMTFGVSNSTETRILNELIQIADKRMYLGKRSGKNTVISCDFKLPNV